MQNTDVRERRWENLKEVTGEGILAILDTEELPIRYATDWGIGDANKRTAWTVTQEYLDRCGIEPEIPQEAETIEKIIRRVWLFSIEELARWLEHGPAGARGDELSAAAAEGPPPEHFTTG